MRQTLRILQCSPALMDKVIAIEDEAECAEREAIQLEARLEQEYRPVVPATSFIARYVGYGTQRTDAPPAAHELMAVALMSALAGPGPRLPIATNVKGVPLNIWALYTANTTGGRKTTVVNFAVDIAAEVLGRDAVLLWEGSPQGILQRLQPRDGMAAIFARDEYSGLLAQMNRGGGHMAGLAQLFIRAYDGEPLENIRTKKKNKHTGETEDDTDRVRQPYLVKMCASTYDSLIERATVDNVLDGFLPRFIVFSGSAESRPMQRSTKELSHQRDALIASARDYHNKSAVLNYLEMDDDVLRLAWSLEQEWEVRAAAADRPEAAGPALKRLAESVLKTAGLLAIDDTVAGEVPRVRAAHFECARQLGERWIPSTLVLIDALGRTTFQKSCQAVLATIRGNPIGMRVRDVYRKHRRLDSRQFSDVLAALQTQDEIVITEGDTNKGPAFRFVRATTMEEL
jgi:hypothetical protein